MDAPKQFDELFADLADLSPSEQESRLKAIDDQALVQRLRSFLQLDFGPIAESPRGIEPAETFAGLKFRNYELGAQLGKGGYGCVYAATQTVAGVKRDVAIKILTTRDGGILREHRTLMAMDHPNIVPMLDGGISEPGEIGAIARPFLVMERIHGEPIDRYCDQQRLTIRQRLALFLQLCDAVSYAHMRMVLHRDIKPDNVLITNDGVLKLVDFGLAQQVSPQSTLTNRRRHSTGYCPPEQVLGTRMSPASDVYALGALLYKLLTGRAPFSESNAVVFLEAVRSRMPDLPSDCVNEDHAAQKTATQARRLRPGALARQLRGDLDTITLKTLQKSPQMRYQQVSELRDDLDRYLAGQPVTARRPTLWYRTGKLLSRDKPLSAVLCLLIAGFAYEGHTAAMRNVQIDRSARLRNAAETTVRRLLLADYSTIDERLIETRQQQVLVALIQMRRQMLDRLEGWPDREVLRARQDAVLGSMVAMGATREKGSAAALRLRRDMVAARLFLAQSEARAGNTETALASSRKALEHAELVYRESLIRSQVEPLLLACLELNEKLLRQTGRLSEAQMAGRRKVALTIGAEGK